MIDWRLNGRAIIGRAYPRILGVAREPSWILFDIFLPLLGIAAYIFYYRAMHAPEMYAGFIVIGGAMTAYWMNVLWSMATQFYWEKEVGNLQLYMLAPMSRMSMLGGMALGGMLMTTIRAASTILLGVFLFADACRLQENGPTLSRQLCQAQGCLGLGGLGPGAFQLLIELRGIDFGQKLPGLDMCADVHKAAFEITVTPSINRGLHKRLDLGGEGQVC